MIAHQPDSFAPAESKRILIVDDNSEIRSIMRQELEWCMGFICGEAQNGLEAIRRARNWKPHLVIMDLTMPVMNGFEAAIALRREMPEVPVVLLTFYDELAAGAKLGCVKAVLSKTDGITELVKCVQSLLHRNVKHPVAPTVDRRSVPN